jgi:hypothetical protein
LQKRKQLIVARLMVNAVQLLYYGGSGSSRNHGEKEIELIAREMERLATIVPKTETVLLYQAAA